MRRPSFLKSMIHTQTLFTDCHRHSVSCVKYSGLCVHSGNNYFE